MPAHLGAGGVYIVQIGSNKFSGTIRQGNQVVEALGRVALPPGNYEIRVAAKEITGEELMRFRNVTLKAVKD